MTVFRATLRNADRRALITLRLRIETISSLETGPQLNALVAMNARSAPAPSPNIARFTLYVAFVLSMVMVLFPPFTSLNGTEYAFLLTGPEWSRLTGALGEDLGLTARLHWILLLVQLAAVWAIAFGAKRFLGKQPVVPAVLLGFFSFLPHP